MFQDADSYFGQTEILMLSLFVATVLAAVYFQRSGDVPYGEYSPALAWLRAGMYFCLCVVVGTFSGVLDFVSKSSLVTAEQMADPTWISLTATCFAAISFSYIFLWSRGTFNDDRQHHRLLSLAYGCVWGICHGILLLSFWSAIEFIGLSVVWVALISFFVIASYTVLYHYLIWDAFVSPPHNYSEWKWKKVAFCYLPNLAISLVWLAMYSNAGLFLLLQGYGFAIAAYVMRFPAFNDDYRPNAGQERSIVDDSVTKL